MILLFLILYAVFWFCVYGVLIVMYVGAWILAFMVAAVIMLVQWIAGEGWGWRKPQAPSRPSSPQARWSNRR